MCYHHSQFNAHSAGSCSLLHHRPEANKCTAAQFFQHDYVNSAANVEHLVYVGFVVDKVILGQVSLRLFIFAPVITVQPILRNNV